MPTPFFERVKKRLHLALERLEEPLLLLTEVPVLFCIDRAKPSIWLNALIAINFQNRRQPSFYRDCGRMARDPRGILLPTLDAF
jgi:hypothetical protein